MPELVWKFNTFKLRWFPFFGVFTPLNVWTDEGQPCDYSASCSILPAFRMCTHHYTTCVGIPIFRHQSYPDKGRLIQKSPVCWDYVPEMGFVRGKRWGLHPSAAGKTHCSGSNAQYCAIDEFRESWGEDMARDLEWFRVDTNWHTTSNTNFHHEKQRDYDLDYHWISLAATFLEHLEDCIHSHHLSSTMRPMDFGQVNCIERQRFPKFSVEARYSKRNPGPPSLSQRDVEAPGAGGKCFQPQHVSFGCETWW